MSSAESRNKHGRISMMSAISLISAIGALAGNASFEYDELGRLKTSTNDGVVTTYTYDAAGNRTSVQVGAPPTTPPTNPTTNRAPTCTSLTVTISGPPPSVGATVTVTSTMVLQRCTDADGDTLTVTSPALPRSSTLFPRQSFVTDFVVTDGKGGSASGTLTFTRP
jgi:YD repeat-containing protein